jgi:U2-associated protein SR140
MDGTQKKKTIDQSLEQLRKKFNKDDTQSAAGEHARARAESEASPAVPTIGFISPII